MERFRQPARINVKALIVFLSVIFLVGVGGVVAHYVRKGMIAEQALAAGNAALEREDWVSACKYLKRYLSKYPDDAEVLQRYAEAHLSVRPRQPGNIGAAIGAYRRLLRYRPGDEHICKELARLYFSLGDFTETAYVCGQRLSVDADDPDALLWLGRALAAQKKRSEAMATLSRLVAGHPDRVSAYSLLSTLELQGDVAGGMGAAAKWLDAAVEANPESLEAHVRRARFRRLVQRDETAARDDLEAAEALPCDDPRVLLLAADEWMRWREFDRASAYLRLVDSVDLNAVRRYGVDPDLLALAKFTTAATLTLENPDSTDHGALADHALESLPRPQRLRFLPTAVKLYLAAGHLDRASASLEEFRTAVEGRVLGEGAKETLAILSAQVAETEDRPYEAINLLVDQGGRRRPSVPALRALADGFYATGQAGRAREILRQYVEEAPQDWDAWLQLARAYRHHDWERTLMCANTAWRGRPTLAAKLLVLEARMMRASGRADEPRVLKATLSELEPLRDQFPDNVNVRVLTAGVMAEQGRLEAGILELEECSRVCERPLAAEMMLVDLYARSDRKEQARVFCEETVARHPDLAAPRLRLADLQLGADQQDAARQTYEEALAHLTGAERVTATEAFARFLLDQGERTAAIELLDQLAAERPRDVEIRLSLLRIPEVRAEAEKRQRLIDEMAAIEGPGGVRWKLQQAGMWLETGNWRAHEPQIRELLDDCVRADPGWEPPVLLLGRLFKLSGQLREAEKAYRTALAHYPNALAVADRLVDLLKRQSRYVEAQEVLDTVPRTTAALSAHRIDLAIGRGDFDQALQGLELYVAANPDDVAARVRLARLVYVVRKDRDRALKLLDQAAESAPNSVEVLFARVAVLQAEGRQEEAVALLNAEVQRLDNFPVYWLRATYFTAIKEFELAEKDYIHLTRIEDSAPAGYGLLGDFYYTRGRPSEAIAVWEAGLEVYPENVTLRRALVRGLVRSPDAHLRARGRVLLRELQRQFPDDAELLRVEAVLLLEDRTPEATARATSNLERAVTLNPGSVAAHRMLIALARREGDLQRARTLVARALATNPAQASLKADRIAVEMELGNTGVARELGRALLEDYQSDLAVSNRLADLFRKAGDTELAARFNEEALRVAPGDAFANITRAAILVAQGEDREALAHLEAFVKTDAGRQSLPAQIALASQYTAQRDFESADRVLRSAEERSPGHAGVAVERLRWLAAQNRLNDVREKLAAYTVDSAEHVPVILAAANLLAASGNTEYLREARRAYDRVRQAASAIPAAHLGFAQVTYQLGRVEEAIDALRTVLKLNPDDRVALNNLAWMLADTDDPDALSEAATLVERGIARYPGDIHLCDTYGVVQFKLGRLQKAREHLETCVALAENASATRAKALLHLARVLVAEKADPSRIRAGLEEAKKIDEAHHFFSVRERDDLAKLLDSL